MTLLQASPEHLIHWLLDDSTQSLQVFGQENGFNERADVVRAADGTDLNDFWNEVIETIQIRNQKRNSIINALTYPVVEASSEVVVPSEVDFQKASEYGQPVGIKGTATRFFRGYDFDFYDLAIRFTWMFIAEAGIDDLRMNHNLALEADTKLQFRKVMERLFNPINSSGYFDDNTPITVYAAYNGDGEVPPSYNHVDFDGTHNHYLVSGGATITSANVDALQDTITEHGYNLQGGYRLVLWVNKQEADVIKTFRTANGDKYDFVPNPNLRDGAIWVPNDGSYVGGPEGRVPGEIGTYGSFHVVEEGYIPAGYIVGIATGGIDRLTNPIGIRQHSNPAYRGLKIIPGQRSQYPLIDSFYRRGIGTGIRQRGSIALMQIKATGNFAIPAAYDPATF